MTEGSKEGRGRQGGSNGREEEREGGSKGRGRKRGRMKEGEKEGTTTTGCCTPTVVAEVRYAGVEQAAGYRGILA